MTDHLSLSGASACTCWRDGHELTTSSEGDCQLHGRDALRGSNERSEHSSARDLPRIPPLGWDNDLWQGFRSGAIYEEEVPRNCDGEPLFDADGFARKGVGDEW